MSDIESLVQSINQVSLNIGGLGNNGDVIIVFGPTGVGKSTTISYLYGDDLVVKGDYTLEDSQGSVRSGGRAWTKDVTNYGSYLDTPGWQDIGGYKYAEIINSATIKLIEKEKNIKNIKILLLIDEITIGSDHNRYNPMKEYFKMLFKQFKCLNGDILDSVGLLITKVENKPDAIYGVREKLNKIINDQDNIFSSSSQRFLKYIVDHDRFTIFKRPNEKEVENGKLDNSDERKEEKNKILRLVSYEDEQILLFPTPNQEGIFNYAISAGVINELNKDFVLYLDKNEEDMRVYGDSIKNVAYNDQKLFNDINIAEIFLKILNLLEGNRRGQDNSSMLSTLKSRLTKESSALTIIKDLEDIDRKLKEIGHVLKVLEYKNHFYQRLEAYDSKFYEILQEVALPAVWSLFIDKLRNKFVNNIEMYGYKFDIDPHNSNKMKDLFKGYMEEFELNVQSVIERVEKNDKREENIRDLVETFYAHLSAQDVAEVRLLQNKEYFIKQIVQLYISGNTILKDTITNAINESYRDPVEKVGEGEECTIRGQYVTTYEIQSFSFICKKTIVVKAESIIVNFDLTLKGQDLRMEAAKLILSKAKIGTYKFDLSGEDGASHNDKAEDGALNEKGKDGTEGGKGKNGGNFYGIFDTVRILGGDKKIEVNVSGGKGGNGQDSGNGGPVSQGSHGVKIKVSYDDVQKKIKFYEDYSNKLNKLAGNDKPKQIDKKYLCSANGIGIIPETQDDYDISWKCDKFEGSFWSKLLGNGKYLNTVTYYFFSCGQAPKLALSAGKPGKGGECGKVGNMKDEYKDGHPHQGLFVKVSQDCINGQDGKAGTVGPAGVYGKHYHQKITIYDQDTASWYCRVFACNDEKIDGVAVPDGSGTYYIESHMYGDTVTGGGFVHEEL